MDLIVHIPDEAVPALKAKASGLPLETFAEQVLLERIHSTTADAPAVKTPTRSLRGLLAKYGQAPSAQDIDDNRAEMFANFPRSDF